jgi:UDP-glucose 4-epimerase
MKALITGGAGFIGSHLSEYLLARGDTVTVLDDLSTGRLGNLSRVLDNPALSFHQGSILDADLVRRLAADADVVFHLAAALGVYTILEDPLGSLKTNLVGTEVVLDAAREARCRILVASTSEIYGKNTTIGLAEDDDRVMGSPLKARWSYAEAKALDETLTHLYRESGGLSAVIVRLFNTVGPRQTGRYGMVVPRFVGQALAGEPLTVHGSGEQTRCFCHVAEVVPALVRLVEQPGAQKGVFNLGNSQQISIGQLARTVVEVLGSTSDIVRVPYEEAYGPGYEDMQRRVPDCSRARELIGFEPSLDVEYIIHSVAAAIRSERSAAADERSDLAVLAG